MKKQPQPFTTPGRETLSIAVACGGTGGHIFPGMATAAEMRRRGHRITLWLAGRDIENRTLKDWGGPVFRTGARPLRPATLPSLLGSLWRAGREMRRERPDVILAMGSYASLPPVVSARLLGIPVVLHEANVVPGKAVAALSRLAAVTAISCPESAPYLPHARLAETGLPVRKELAGRSPMAGFERQNGFTVLITGGSQGAHALNVICAAGMIESAQSRRIPGLRIIHQTGAADEKIVRDLYRQAGVEALVTPFLADMGGAYAAADLAICRAGAATCAELCLCGLPALLVPLPTAVRDHQHANAQRLARVGGADVCRQQELTPEGLAQQVLESFQNPRRREAMRAALRSLALPDADRQLANLVERAATGPLNQA